jgi:hypothetical protein
MKRLAGTPNPRSWKEMKLTTYPGGGDGAAPLVGGIHSGCLSSERGRSKPSATRSSRSWIARRDDGHPVSHHRAKGVAAERTGWAVSFSPAKPLRLRNPKEEARSGAKNRRQTHPGYIKTKARPVQRFARTRRGIQKPKAKRPFLERLAHAQRPPREPLAPSH